MLSPSIAVTGTPSDCDARIGGEVTWPSSSADVADSNLDQPAGILVGLMWHPYAPLVATSVANWTIGNCSGSDRPVGSTTGTVVVTSAANSVRLVSTASGQNNKSESEISTAFLLPIIVIKFVYHLFLFSKAPLLHTIPSPISMLGLFSDLDK